jgi:aromatic-L-amino-acid decarboxylase
VIRHYGIEGLQYHIRKHVNMAQQFSRWIEQDDDFELVAPVPLNLICFRHKKGDTLNAQLENRLNASGKLYLTHTKLNNRYILRLCIGQTNTEQQHVEKAWKLRRETASELNGNEEDKIKDQR